MLIIRCCWNIVASTDDLLSSVSLQPKVAVDLLYATSAYLSLWSEQDLKLCDEELQAICDLAVNGLKVMIGFC